MKNLVKYTLISIVFCLAMPVNADTLKINEKQKVVAIQSELSILKDELKENQGDLEKIRNDQINYKVEKDLLKEIYSTSLSTVNTVVSAGLAFITVLITILGYLGLRSIKEMQSEYKNELEKVKEVKNNFDIEFNSYKDKQAIFDDKVGLITKTNEDQDRRLKTLELIEKISGLVNKKLYEWALTHISIGLESDPENLHLLQLKATCNGKMGNFSAFIETNKRLLNSENNEVVKPDIAMNLLEGYAITNQKDEFDNLYSTYKDSINKRYDGSVGVYLNVIMDISSGKLAGAIKALKTYTEKQPNNPPYKHLGNWSFVEANIFSNNLTDEKSKSLASSAIRFFNGEMNNDDFIKFLATL